MLLMYRLLNRIISLNRLLLLLLILMALLLVMAAPRILRLMLLLHLLHLLLLLSHLSNHLPNRSLRRQGPSQLFLLPLWPILVEDLAELVAAMVEAVDPEGKDLSPRLMQGRSQQQQQQ